MGKLGFLLNGVLVSGIVTVLFLGSEGVAAPILNADQNAGQTQAQLTALESEVAITPAPENVVKLAGAYLDRDQPGLAQAALDRLPVEQADPSLLHARSRVSLAQGRGEEALAFSRSALAACEHPGSSCQGGLYARVLQQSVALEAMNAAGVQDPAAEPERARVAMAGATRQVRLVAEH